jgi:hypothetical protein
MDDLFRRSLKRLTSLHFIIRTSAAMLLVATFFIVWHAVFPQGPGIFGSLFQADTGGFVHADAPVTTGNTGSDNNGNGYGNSSSASTGCDSGLNSNSTSPCDSSSL